MKVKAERGPRKLGELANFGQRLHRGLVPGQVNGQGVRVDRPTETGTSAALGRLAAELKRRRNVA